jgi:Fur family ferric uptake transcriptional regulator
MKSNQPISAEQIYFELKEMKLGINISTVYRTLETLEDKGMVTKLSIMDDDRMLFEYNKMGHRHYLICISCKKIVTLDNCPLGAYEKKLQNETNFDIIGHRLYLYGYCSDCQKNNVGVDSVQ